MYTTSVVCRIYGKKFLILKAVLLESYIYEPHREKTGFLHMQNKDADQLRYTDSTIPPLPKSKISSL